MQMMSSTLTNHPKFQRSLPIRWFFALRGDLHPSILLANNCAYATYIM
jgi:hypothetical protein